MLWLVLLSFLAANHYEVGFVQQQAVEGCFDDIRPVGTDDVNRRRWAGMRDMSTAD